MLTRFAAGSQPCAPAVLSLNARLLCPRFREAFEDTLRLADRDTRERIALVLLESPPAGAPGYLPALHARDTATRAKARALWRVGDETIERAARANLLDLKPGADRAAAPRRALVRLEWCLRRVEDRNGGVLAGGWVARDALSLHLWLNSTPAWNTCVPGTPWGATAIVPHPSPGSPLNNAGEVGWDAYKVAALLLLGDRSKA